jgi:hypothetical protein
MYNFKNTVLIVVFNYSNCICNKNEIKNIYEKYFKKIFFYSDYPVIEDDEVNFINISSGFYTHNIFSHFYSTYKSFIENSDGLFYTMDDNIINLNILNLFDSEKIIYYYNEVKPLNNYSGWNWDLPYGKTAINNLLNDSKFNKYDINNFSGGFADWFYLPKKYLTNNLFKLFNLFSKHKIHLELAIPSIINNIEKNKSNYQPFTDEILWGHERNKVNNKNYVYNSFNHNHNIILHPIKFNIIPNSKDWLKEIFCKDECVIIRTINKPCETIINHINNTECDVIIVGDHDTPDDYKKLNCIYLDILSQKKLFPELSELLPYNHYIRKNLGYLYAIKRGYKKIYKNDTDNIPYDNFNNDITMQNYADILKIWNSYF